MESSREIINKSGMVSGSGVECLLGYSSGDGSCITLQGDSYERKMLRSCRDRYKMADGQNNNEIQIL